MPYFAPDTVSFKTTFDGGILKSNVEKSFKMKFEVLLVLACVSVCCVNSATNYTWGRVTNRTLGTKNIVIPSTIFQVKNYTFTYPGVSWIKFKINTFFFDYPVFLIFRSILLIVYECIPHLWSHAHRLQITPNFREILERRYRPT